MKIFHRFISIFLTSLFSISVISSSFICNYIPVKANALPSVPLDPSAFQVINGGAQSDFYGFGSSPEFISFGINQAIDDINTKLYSEYGWDMETILWDVEDMNNQLSSEQDALVQSITGNIYSSYSEALADGYYLFKYHIPFAVESVGQQAYQVIMGKINSATNTIVDVFNNAVVPINDYFFNNMTDVVSDEITDGNITDLTFSGSIYTKTFACEYDNYRRYNEFTADRPLFWFRNDSYNSYYSDSHTLYVAWPTNSPTPNAISASLIQNGVAVDVSRGSFTVDRYINVNGVQFTVARPKIWYNAGSSNTDMYTLDDIMTQSELVTYLGQFNPECFVYQWDTNTLLMEILNLLRGHYVTTDDLKKINNVIQEVPIAPAFYPNPQPNGDPLPGAVPKPTDDWWSLLQETIEDALDTSIGIDPYFPPVPDSVINPDPSPDPDPDPEPSPNPDPVPDVPPSYPSWIVPSFFTDLLDHNLFSIFQPVFDIVGGNYSMFSTWLVIPSVIIFVVILWIIITIL